MGGLGGSVWVMGEWSVGQWIVGVISFQKMYGLYGLKHHIVEKSGDVTDPDGQTTRKDRATQLLICEKLSLAILTHWPLHLVTTLSVILQFFLSSSLCDHLVTPQHICTISFFCTSKHRPSSSLWSLLILSSILSGAIFF